MKWTKEEQQFLIDNYANKGPVYCAEQLGRGYEAVRKNAAKLNLKVGWTKEEEQFLVENYYEYGPAYCTEQLGKTKEAVKSKAFRLDLTTNNKSWTIEEIQFLIDNYADKGPTCCAEELNRTYEAVKIKAGNLSLKANTRYDSNIVYLVYFSELFLYKVGITNCVERRTKTFGQPCVVLSTQECETAQEAAQLERDLLKSVTRINTGKLNSGNTETFTEPSEKIKEFLGKEYAYL